MEYKTVNNCPVCRHPERKDIERLFLEMRGGLFINFEKKVKEKYGIPCKGHFKGSNQKGKKYPPHFNVDEIFNKEDASHNEVIDLLRKRIEEQGLKIAGKKLEEILSGKQKISIKDVISMLNAVNKSTDSRKIVDIKERELKSNEEKFDKLFTAALYGRKKTIPVEGKIKDAEIIEEYDTNENSVKDDGGKPKQIST